MAATGYTPIYIYYSSTTSNVPSAGNLGYGELAINITDGKLFYKNNSNAVVTIPVLQSSATQNGWLSSTDWSTFNGKASAVTYTTNYIPYGNGTTTPALSAGLQFDGTNFTTTGNATAKAFIPSSSTIPTNGLYLPAANNVGIATNSTNAIYIDNSQLIGFGTTSMLGRITAQGVVGTNPTLVAGSGNIANAAVDTKTGSFRNHFDTNSGFSTYWTSFRAANGTSYRLILGVASGSGDVDVMTLFGTGGVSIGNSTDPGATNLSVSGVIKTATWNGATIGTGYGGTGLTTFTAANNAIYSTSSSALTAGTLPVAAGGTGLTTLTANYIPYGNGTSAFSSSAALTFDGTSLKLSNTIVGNATPPAYSFDAATCTVTLTNGSTVNFGTTFSGFIAVTDASVTGQTAILTCGGGVTYTAGSGNFTNTSGSGTFRFYDGGSGYVLKNSSGSTVTFGIFAVRTRAST